MVVLGSEDWGKHAESVGKNETYERSDMFLFLRS